MQQMVATYAALWLLLLQQKSSELHHLITYLQQMGMLTSAALLDAHLLHFLIDKHRCGNETERISDVP
jgi:hypothetical protein